MTLAERLVACGGTLSRHRVERGRTHVDLTIGMYTFDCSGVDLIGALRECEYWLDEVGAIVARTIDADCVEMAEATRFEMGGEG